MTNYEGQTQLEPLISTPNCNKGNYGLQKEHYYYHAGEDQTLDLRITQSILLISTTL